MSEKKRILITGGAGYIGSHVLNLLGQEGHDIVVWDNLSTGRKESILYGEHVCEDLENIDLLEKVIAEKKFHAVLHFAGSIIVPESVEKPLKYYQNNVANSLNLIDLCVKHKVKHFIFSSTAAVYGIPEGGVAKESTPTAPINPYGQTKLMTETMLKDTAFAYGNDFSYVVLRYFNVAGANVEGLVGQCSPQSTHLLKVACEVATGKRDSMNIYGDDYETKDGTCIRDYIHVDDLAMAHIDALNYLFTHHKSEVLNCGYGQGHTVKEMIEAVREVSGHALPAEVVGRRAGDAPILMSEANRIRELLGWRPRYNDLKVIVKTALDWEAKLGR